MNFEYLQLDIKRFVDLYFKQGINFCTIFDCTKINTFGPFKNEFTSDKNISILRSEFADCLSPTEREPFRAANIKQKIINPIACKLAINFRYIYNFFAKRKNQAKIIINYGPIFDWTHCLPLWARALWAANVNLFSLYFFASINFRFAKIIINYVRFIYAEGSQKVRTCFARANLLRTCELASHVDFFFASRKKNEKNYKYSENKQKKKSSINETGSLIVSTRMGREPFGLRTFTFPVYFRNKETGSKKRFNSNPIELASSFLGGKIKQAKSELNSNRTKGFVKPPKGVESTKQSKAVSLLITYEEIGLFPRSFSRVLDRFLKQVFSDVELFVVQEYRFYRYLFLTTFQSLFLLFFVPFLINFFAKNYLVRPLADYFWNTQQTEIFLNSYQQKRAFAELKDFEEKLYFESLVTSVKDKQKKDIYVATSKKSEVAPPSTHKGFESTISDNLLKLAPGDFDLSRPVSSKLNLNRTSVLGTSLKPITDTIEQKNLPSRDFARSKQVVFFGSQDSYPASFFAKQKIGLQERLQQKTLELAIRYNNQSIDSITNFFADFFSFVTLFYLLIAMEIQINITKSFLLEVFFGLDDSKKSLLILLTTDLLVGYHSPNIWELFFNNFFNRYGIPESQTGIFLLVATLPVLLDVLFKYLIFRHLNRASPATVATYHAMIE